jgi:intraflagellar transport protein 80
VQYVCYVKNIPIAEAREAELALLRKQPKEAESILLSANLNYRCIRMWIDLYNWERFNGLTKSIRTCIEV